MTDRPNLEPGPDRFHWLFFNGIIIGLLVLVFNPLVFSLGYVVQRVWKKQQKSIWVQWGSWGVVALSGIWFFYKFPVFYVQPRNDFFATVLLSIPTIPVMAVLLDFYWKVSVFLKPRSLDERIDEDRQRLTELEARSSKDAHQTEQELPDQVPEWLRLGRFIRYTAAPFPKDLGIQISSRTVTAHAKLLPYHWFLVGTTGAGKSETIKRLIYEIAVNTDNDIYLVDGKGEDELAQFMRSVCYLYDRGNTPIFRMGMTEPSHPYNGFVGQPEDIYNRLAAIVGIEEAEGNAGYYADINRYLLQLVCYSPEGVPRSFKEVLQRLDLSWLKSAWKNDPDELANLRHLQGDKKSDKIEGLRDRIRPLVRPLEPLVNQDGFVLEDVRSAIFSIRTQSVGDTSKRLLQFLIEDIKDFVGKRQKRKGVLIIDEFGMFGNDNIIALLALARSADFGVILATQDIVTLGDEATARSILSNTNTLVLMQTKYPQEIIDLAGTTYQVESSIQHEEGAPTGMGSARLQDTYVVKPNEVRRLRPGEAFIIRQNYAAKMRVSRVLKLGKGDRIPPEPKAKSVSPDQPKPDKPAIEF